ncbi:MAG: SRPBCC family protein [Bacteroidetes bacterium]|jgi:uncharacterized protein YndB with AHSA1/START domain|nr:SRPBCC family protein [Bacteroidota bacterium]
MKVSIEAMVQAPVERVWECYTGPQHIVGWNQASDDWCCPRAENEVKVGGRYMARMESTDGSMGFDFVATYLTVEKHKQLAYKMEDGREADIQFVAEPDGTKVHISFDAEGQHPAEMQRAGWQAILNNFKRYTEMAD